MASRRVDVKAILADPDLRRQLMVSTIQATQAREGIETTPEQADRAYHVVTQQERCAFFDLARYRGTRQTPEGRHSAFVRAICKEGPGVRTNVALRDFSSIDGSPLAYRALALVAHIFRDHPALDPAWALARQGLATSEDSRWLREFWEVSAESIGRSLRWAPLAKGGEFSRFYFDHHLIIKWENDGRELKDFIVAKDGTESKRVYSQEHYFKPGLTWPRAAAVFNVRLLPSGHIFADKGPVVLPASSDDTWFLAGILNSDVVLYLSKVLTSRGEMGGRWEVGGVKRLPIPQAGKPEKDRAAEFAKAIHDRKALWDDGNEVSTRFRHPWLIHPPVAGDARSLPDRLAAVAAFETTEEQRIQTHYAELNDEVYRLYGIPAATRAVIEETMGERPPEILWPQMAGKSPDQKRMEHVWRLLSYLVKRVLESDDDGVVPFAWSTREPSLVDRVRIELAHLLPGQDAAQLEVEITNELKTNVRGYRRCAGIEDWLANAFFTFHCALYKSRPIFWHIASAQGTTTFAFGALVHYHRFDKNRLAKLRASYLRDVIEDFRREAGLADKEGRAEDRREWQSRLEETQALDRKLQLIHEGHHEGPEGGERDYRILTPWKSASQRPKGWDPDLDDGVKVNIEPFEKAGVLRVGKVT